MEFWKENTKLRLFIITACFAAGLTLIIVGWKMVGKLTGLGIMILGLALLLTALMVYNKPFEDPKH